MANAKDEKIYFALRIPVSLRDKLTAAGARVNLRPTAYASLILTLAMRNETENEKIIDISFRERTNLLNGPEDEEVSAKQKS